MREVRTRGAALLGVGAVIASLLAAPVFRGPHPEGWLETITAGVGLLACVATLLFAVQLLRPDALGFSLKPAAAYRALWKQESVEQPQVDLALAEELEAREEANGVAVARLALYLELTLVAIAAETAGLAAAAVLAS